MQSRYELAGKYISSERYSLGLKECFEMIKKEKHWNDDAARKLCLQVFEKLGNKEEVVKEGRKRLSNLWYV